MIALIAAMTRNRVIGVDNRLPWDLPEDLKHFRERTKGNTVVMGRRTYESIGRPLPHRTNIVVSTTAQQIPGVTVCGSVEEALAAARSSGKDIYVIGGSSIFAATLPLADQLIISWVKKDYEGDTYFPHFDEEAWDVASRDDRGEFEIVTYTRRTEEP